MRRVAPETLSPLQNGKWASPRLLAAGRLRCASECQPFFCSMLAREMSIRAPACRRSIFAGVVISSSGTLLLSPDTSYLVTVSKDCRGGAAGIRYFFQETAAMRATMALLISAGFLAGIAPAMSQTAGGISTRPHCIYSGQIDNWKAADAKTIYLRVAGRRYYRLDLAYSCHELTRPGAFLITELRGSNFVCDALDWDLHVATSWDGIPQACMVKKMTEISPDEAASIPRRFRP